MDIQDNGEMTISLHSVQTLKDKKDEAISHKEYTSKVYLEPHNSHPFQLQPQILTFLTKLKYFLSIG